MTQNVSPNKKDKQDAAIPAAPIKKLSAKVFTTKGESKSNTPPMATAGLSEPLRSPSEYPTQHFQSNAEFVDTPQRTTKVTYAPIAEVNTDKASSAESYDPPRFRKKYYPSPQATAMLSDESETEADLSDGSQAVFPARQRRFPVAKTNGTKTTSVTRSRMDQTPANISRLYAFRNNGGDPSDPSDDSDASDESKPPIRRKITSNVNKTSKSKGKSSSGTINAKKITEFFPTKYSGSGPPDASLGHWYNFSDFLEHHDISNDKKVLELFKKTLTGSARAWFEQLPGNLTCTELRDEFFNKYYMDIASRTTASDKFWNFEKKDKESWSEAVGRLKLLNNRLEYKDQTVIDKLCCLLPLQIRIRMKEIQPSTIDEVLEIIRFYEQEGLNTDSPVTKSGASKRASVMEDRSRNPIRQVKLGTSQPNTLTMSYGNYNRPADVTCFHCQRKGHYARNCYYQNHQYSTPSYGNYREQRPLYAPHNMAQLNHNPRQPQRQFNRSRQNGNQYEQREYPSLSDQQREPHYRNGNRMTAQGHDLNTGHDLNSGHSLSQNQPPSNVRQNNGPNNRNHRNENFQ